MTRNANIRNEQPRLKTQVITFSWRFPDYHPRRDEQTWFCPKLLVGLGYPLPKNHFPLYGESKAVELPKKHTIRGNFALWSKRAARVQAGEMRVSMKHWSGVPYRSKQYEFLSHNYLGVQQITMCNPVTGLEAYVDGRQVDIDVLAANDGLSCADFEAWFAPHFKTSNVFEGVVIHFTPFRY